MLEPELKQLLKRIRQAGDLTRPGLRPGEFFVNILNFELFDTTYPQKGHIWTVRSTSASKKSMCGPCGPYIFGKSPHMYLQCVYGSGRKCLHGPYRPHSPAGSYKDPSLYGRGVPYRAKSIALVFWSRSDSHQVSFAYFGLEKLSC